MTQTASRADLWRGAEKEHRCKEFAHGSESNLKELNPTTLCMFFNDAKNTTY